MMLRTQALMFLGPSWAQPRYDSPRWSALHRRYVTELSHARQTGKVRCLMIIVGGQISVPLRGMSLLLAMSCGTFTN